MMETMAVLVRLNRDYFVYGDYEIRRIYGRWYIGKDDTIVADFTTLNECRYWIGER